MKYKKIHIIGIGGKGLFGIARICKKLGLEVFGSDVVFSPNIERLRKDGIDVFIGHKRENITKDIEVVVFPSNLKMNNLEILEAKKLKIKTLKRSEFLGEMINNYKTVCVAGSHGKSTTTALLGLVMESLDMDPTVFGGAFTKEFGSNERFGKGEWAVVESCEFDKSFLNLIGNHAIITAVENSHPEYYKNEKKMLDAFSEFLDRFSVDAQIFINGDDLNARKVASNKKAQIVTVGFNHSNDYVIANYKLSSKGCEFDLVHNRVVISERIRMSLFGKYNMLNVALILAFLHKQNINFKKSLSTIEKFTGLSRRCEIFSLDNGSIIVDDCAHHPTQVRNVIDATRQRFGGANIVAVFEPCHAFLIKSFIKQYGSAFLKADEVIVTKIFPSWRDSEKDIENLKPEEIVYSIKSRSGTNTKYIEDHNDLIYYLIPKAMVPNTVILTIGTGNIIKIPKLLHSKILIHTKPGVIKYLDGIHKD